MLIISAFTTLDTAATVYSLPPMMVVVNRAGAVFWGWRTTFYDMGKAFFVGRRGLGGGKDACKDAVSSSPETSSPETSSPVNAMWYSFAWPGFDIASVIVPG